MVSMRPVGEQLRAWRQRRRLSQLALATEAEISTKHLSFLETGRAQPSREMLLHLAERLDVPLRERNALLLAAGFAPAFSERRLEDPALAEARATIDLVLKGHEPYPALAIDRHWTLLAANSAVQRLLKPEDPALLQPPVNVLRISLHPKGLAPSIINLAEWRAHLISRLRRQVDVSADPALTELLEELVRYPAPVSKRPLRPEQAHGVVIPLQLATEIGTLSFISTTTVFGTPIDITLSELAIEAFFPADTATAGVLQRLVKHA